MNNTDRSRVEKAPNLPYDEVKKGRVKTRLWKNRVTAQRTELVADFVRRSNRNATEAFAEMELLEISVLAKRAWKICRRHRRRQELWSLFRKFF